MIREIVVACVLAWVCVTLGIALRRAVRAFVTGARPFHRTPVRGAFPVLPPRTVGASPGVGLAPMVEGIRRYRVVGVDAVNRGDVAYLVDAATAANAKVKAELAGVIVTEVVEAAGPSNAPRSGSV